MKPKIQTALKELGITDEQIKAMGKQLPAGTPRNPAYWNDYDKRSLPIYAANCLEPDWQSYYEDEYMGFIQWRKG